MLISKNKISAQIKKCQHRLAARLATQKGADISALEDALDMMRTALKENRPEGVLDEDLKFHLELCRSSGNMYVVEHVRKILFPLFAFARIRILSSDASAWGKDLEAHQRIIDLIQEGQGDIPEQYVRHAMARFAQNGYSTWEKKQATPPKLP